MLYNEDIFSQNSDTISLHKQTLQAPPRLCNLLSLFFKTTEFMEKIKTRQRILNYCRLLLHSRTQTTHGCLKSGLHFQSAQSKSHNIWCCIQIFFHSVCFKMFSLVEVFCFVLFLWCHLALQQFY